MFWFWSTINDARERQGKRRRGLSEKAAANVFLSRKMQEGLELIATGRRLKRLASATELDFSSLELKEQIGSGAHGVVYKCVLSIDLGGVGVERQVHSQSCD